MIELWRIVDRPDIDVDDFIAACEAINALIQPPGPGKCEGCDMDVPDGVRFCEDCV